MQIRVHVEADHKRERITKVGEHLFQITVREPRVGNRANSRVRELVARAYGVLPVQVRILTGHRSSSKIIDVEV